MKPFGQSPFDEDVRGFIIGEVTFPYEFWQGKERICRGSFENDEEAIAWFKENYPKEFKQGAEMRVFD